MDLERMNNATYKTHGRGGEKMDMAGFEGETQIMTYLNDLGYSVVDSSYYEDRSQDIDLWLNGVPTSIKCQHGGLRINPRTGRPYDNIYVEVMTEIRNGAEWSLEALRDLEAIAGKSWTYWEKIGSAYNPSWWFTGSAVQYLILQGSELRLYQKDTLRAAMLQGYGTLRGLSPQALKGQNGQNSVCAYLDRNKVPYETQWIM